MNLEFGMGLLIAFVIGVFLTAWYFEGRIKALEEKLQAAGQ